MSTKNSTPVIPGGYVLIARKLFLGDLMDKPPLYFKLWAWMLDRANWKDRDKLRRGQLLATIAEMQDAMSYRVGYRKSTPTKDEIRSAYEAFVKATMITTAKTTRGMIITICNYELYQNPKNYEPHSETRNETPAKPAVTPHDTEEGEEGKEGKVKTLSSSGDEELSMEVDFFVTKKKRKLTGKRLHSFNSFWDAFGYKAGKAEAADAWLDITSMTDSLVSRIVAAAEKESQRRPGLRGEGLTPKMAQGWLSARRWEDEDIVVVVAVSVEGQAVTPAVTAEESIKLRKIIEKTGSLYDN